MAGRLMSKGSANSLTVRSPVRSRSSRARRVGSAIARKTSVWACAVTSTQYGSQRQNVNACLPIGSLRRLPAMADVALDTQQGSGSPVSTRDETSGPAATPAGQVSSVRMFAGTTGNAPGPLTGRRVAHPSNDSGRQLECWHAQPGVRQSVSLSFVAEGLLVGAFHRRIRVCWLRKRWNARLIRRTIVEETRGDGFSDRTSQRTPTDCVCPDA